MPLSKNQQAVRALVAELEPRILGQEKPGWSCNCGAHQHGAAIAVRVLPAGDTYPGQETEWYLWTVQMRDPHTTPEGDYSYSIGVSILSIKVHSNKIIGSNVTYDRSTRVVFQTE